MFLQHFYAEHGELREHLKCVATLLREKKLMAVEGAVAQTLKSAALFCGVLASWKPVPIAKVLKIYSDI